MSSPSLYILYDYNKEHSSVMCIFIKVSWIMKRISHSIIYILFINYLFYIQSDVAGSHQSGTRAPSSGIIVSESLSHS